MRPDTAAHPSQSSAAQRPQPQPWQTAEPVFLAWDSHGREPTTTDTTGTAATNTAATSFDARELEVVALKAEVVELKAEVERLKAEVVELKYQETSVREIAASVMRAIATETEECAESLLVYSVDVPGPCVPTFTMLDIGENMEQESNRLRTLSSRLHQLLRQRSSASSGEV